MKNGIVKWTVNIKGNDSWLHLEKLFVISC